MVVHAIDARRAVGLERDGGPMAARIRRLFTREGSER